MDVLTHIKEEHDEFRSLIKEIEAATGDKKKSMFQDLYAKLYGHHEAEETVIFPKAKEAVKGEEEELVLEMYEEHSLARYQFSVLERTSVDNETWDAKFSVLKEVVEHHMEEEENEFLPLARKLFPSEVLDELYDEFEKVMEEKKTEKEKDLA